MAIFKNNLLIPYIGYLSLGTVFFTLDKDLFHVNLATAIGLSLITFFLLSLPFVVLNIYAKKKKRIFIRAIVQGALFWTYLALFPSLLLRMTGLPNQKILFGLLELLISAILIQKYKFAKSFIILGIIFSALANLYFLIYGPLKAQKKN